MAQVLSNIRAIVLFLSIHYIVKKLLQKKFFSMKDEEIIKLFFLSLKKATFFPDQHFYYIL